MTENSAASLQATLTNAGLSANVQADPAGFRMLAVSYCNRDIYSGTGQTDPNNPNKNTDGLANHQRTPGHQGRDCLHRSHVPDVEVLLGRGECRIGRRVLCRLVGAALREPAGRRHRGRQRGQRRGGNRRVPTRRLSERKLRSQRPADYLATIGSPDRRRQQRSGQARCERSAHGAVAAHLESCRYQHLWEHSDAVPVTRRFRRHDGGHRLRPSAIGAAITAEGPNSTSENLPLCVELPGTPSCSLHVVTTHAGLTNSDPASPSNYLAAIMTWVDARPAGP